MEHFTLAPTPTCAFSATPLEAVPRQTQLCDELGVPPVLAPRPKEYRTPAPDAIDNYIESMTTECRAEKEQPMRETVTSHRWGKVFAMRNVLRG